MSGSSSSSSSSTTLDVSFMHSAEAQVSALADASDLKGTLGVVRTRLARLEGKHHGSCPRKRARVALASLAAQGLEVLPARPEDALYHALWEEDNAPEAWAAFPILSASHETLEYVNLRATQGLGEYFREHAPKFTRVERVVLQGAGPLLLSLTQSILDMRGPPLEIVLISETSGGVPFMGICKALERNRIRALALKAPDLVETHMRDLLESAQRSRVLEHIVVTAGGPLRLLGLPRAFGPSVRSVCVNGTFIMQASPPQEQEPGLPGLEMIAFDRPCPLAPILKGGEPWLTRAGAPVPLSFSLEHDGRQRLCAPGKELNDVVVDWFAHLAARVSQREDFVLCAVSDFAHPDHTRPNLIVSQHEWRLQRLLEQNKRFLVVPACILGHHILLVVDPYTQTTRCYDSMRGRNTEEPSQTEKAAFQALHPSVREAAPSLKACETPKQEDSVSCGFFVCALVRRFMLGLTMTPPVYVEVHRKAMVMLMNKHAQQALRKVPGAWVRGGAPSFTEEDEAALEKFWTKGGASKLVE